MTPTPVSARADDIVAEIARASGAKRLQLQPKLARFLSSMERDGIAVPKRLKKLNADLIDEVVEARFDNMPI